jgi:hypothetical protein
MEITVTVPGLEHATVIEGGVLYDRITLPGAASGLVAAAPEFPVLARALRLPAEGTPELEILTARWRDLGAMTPLPSRGPLSRDVDPAAVPRRRGEVYDGDAIWPAEAATLGRPFLVRDRRGAVLRIDPLRWNPQDGGLQALASMTLRVTVRGTGGVNAAAGRPGGPGRGFEAVHRAVFGEDSPGGATKADGDPEGAPHDLVEAMLVVTAPSLRAAVGDLVAWKRECGYTVELRDVDELGGDAAGILAAVRERFESDEGLSHLLLVGDAELVPTHAGSFQGADSDGVYGLVAGDDLYVDVLVSRLPARDAAEARLMIERSIRYERDPRPGAAWYTRAVGIASDEGDPSDEVRCDWLRDDLLAGDFTEVARVYQGDGGERGDIAAAVRGGASLLNYLGHGSGTSWLSVPFEIADVHALTNTEAWPWIVDISCDNGDFSLPESFAEAWLRASHEGRPAGAVAVIAASTASSWVPPCVMQADMVRALAAPGRLELGAVFAAGVAAVLVQYDGTTQAVKLMEQFNLLGDGSLALRTRAPGPLAVTHAGHAPVGTAALAVSLPPGARAVLTDGNAVLARATAGEDAQVTLVPGRPLAAGETVRLTVTARGAVPYRATLPVSEEPDAADAVPEVAALLGNWPNPFNPQTTVGFALPEAGRVRLSVHDLRGRLVRVLVDERRDAGTHQVLWDGRDQGGRAVASGTYLASFETTRVREVRKLTLAR